MEKLGINGIQLLAQLINVSILLIVLKKFLYKPVLHILEKRRANVEEVERQQEELKKRLGDLEQQKKELAKKATVHADELARVAIRDAKKTAAALLKDAELKATKHRERLVRAAEAETVRMKQDVDRLITEKAVKLANEALRSLLSDQTKEQLTERQVEKLLKS